jgi:hypothetical protein
MAYCLIMMKYICEIQTGTKFNRLSFVELAHRDTATRKWNWKCICECGREVVAVGSNIISGRTKSCGCLQKERASAAHKTHGGSGGVSDVYYIWKNMRQRCLNPRNRAYPNYGGRGITICDRWLESFKNFEEDMGPRPSKNHSIDRKDNNGNYCKENCRWSDDEQQVKNRRNTVFAEGNKTLRDWSKEHGVNYYRAYDYIVRKKIPVNFALGVLKTSKEPSIS